MGHKVPPLLESFPVPPSFLPPRSSSSLSFSQSNENSSLVSSLSSPSSYDGHPPWLPPSGPLPPVPGRSRISEHEVAFFLQSRRSSKYSVNSNSDRPDSVASFASARSNGASYAYGTKREPPEVQVTEDTSQAYDGIHEDESQLVSLRLPPSPTDSEHDLNIPSPLFNQFPTPPPLSPFVLQQASAMRSASSTSLSTQGKRAPSPNESLAEISMNDLPSADEGAESEWDVPTTRPSAVKSAPPSSFSAPTTSTRSESRSSLRRTARISVDNLDSASLRASLVSHPTPPNSAPVSSISSPLSSSASPAVESEIDMHMSLHRELRSARSRSRSHRERLNSNPTSPPAEVTWPPMPPVPLTTDSKPRRKASQTSAMSVRTESRDSDDGRASPDIQKLLDKTPRPRRSQSSMRRRTQSSAGTSRRSSLKGSVKGRKSNHSATGSDKEEVWDDLGSRGRTSSQRRIAEVESKLRKLELELDGVGSESEEENRHRRGYRHARHSGASGEGFGFGAYKPEGGESDADSDASDSSLDLHTPLPNLMLRHGLLSPNSKLLPASSSVDSLSSFADGGGTADTTRPGSIMSMVSNGSIQTKSGLYKDIRDTSSRRLRHKDGSLLRGGVGLTTGLGWSDSEDEGAPSALTRRLSSLNLSRNASSVSLDSSRTRSKSYGSLRASASMSSASRPSTLASSSRSSTFSFGSQPNLSRSYSSTLDTDLDGVDEFGEMSYFTTRSKSKGQVPPTSWSGKRSVTENSLRSNSSTLSLKANSKSGDRTPKTMTTGGRIVRSGSEASIYSSASDAAGNMSRTDDFSVLTPSSTASSVSIPLPVTPRDEEALDTPTTSLVFNVDKGLPSLPNPKTGSIRRPAAPSTIGKLNMRKRSQSSSSGTRPFPNITDIPSTPSQSRSNTPSRLLKPLQLPRQHSTNLTGQVPVPVPGLETSRLRMPSQTAPTTPTSPLSPTEPGKPRSRVGAGMAYRSSGSINSKIRTPSGRTPVVQSKF
ncbi:hypothetical protein BDP27DRAFT_1340881 [Rhodocollybia butyracea]|uniref:Uncharacterized protein n=1 Tax=Rhodocollybia butyracea TaxID=206335 RepID=A0A9P5PA46_9AGAR|nr:hypothetical protein BDP27DRAFT_1340881 [Rhodocollybia butyracea]